MGRIGTAQVFNVDDRRSRGPNGRGRTGSVLFETGENWVRQCGSDEEQVRTGRDTCGSDVRQVRTR